MTAIVGIEHKGKVLIGGDSASGSPARYLVLMRSDPKVFIAGDFLIGYTSSFRMGQILQSELPELKTKGSSAFDIMVSQFIPHIRKAFASGGYLKKKDEQESGGTFLVGFRGKLFMIVDDFQVARPMDRFGACGCGDQFLLASMETMKNSRIAPRMRLRKAMTVAAKYSAYVRAPFKILEI